MASGTAWAACNWCLAPWTVRGSCCRRRTSKSDHDRRWSTGWQRIVGIVVALFALGLLAGFLSGLVGVGGGVVIVPFLYFVYGHPELSGFHAAPSMHAAIAHATSLFIIVPTAVSGTLSYQRARLVAWPAAWPIAAASLVAAVVGVHIAVWFPAELLKAAFGVFLVVTGAAKLREKLAAPRQALRLALPRTLFVGAVVGLLSAVLGVGGGMVAIPLLIRLIGLDMERVAGTSIAIVAFTGVAGAITYMVAGLDGSGLPHGSWGYVHWLAALPILTGSLLSVRWGTAVNQRLSARTLRLIFGVLLLAIGTLLLVQNAGAFRDLGPFPQHVGLASHGLSAEDALIQETVSRAQRTGAL